ncbi:hypothetical protein EBZ37_12310, partial [bacterium]|nr:hypothetical protein [bacterium]
MNMGKLLPRIQALALTLLVAGLANGVLLGAFFSDAERAVLGALKVGLEPGRVLQDPYQLAIHLQGLESSGLMDCTKASRQLKQQPVVVYDSSFRGNCGGYWRSLLVPFRKVSVLSSSGEPWSVTFKPTLKRSQIWSLVLANLLLALGAGAALGWYRSHTKKRIQEQQSEIEGLHLIQNIFTQIAHDVRAPLAALNAVASTLGPEAKDEKHVLISAAQRIRGIAQGLLEMKLYRPISRSGLTQATARPVTLEEVHDFIDGLLIEKRSQYRQ